MTRIRVLAWDGDSSGFDWEPVRDTVGVAWLTTRYHLWRRGSESTVVIAEFDVAGYAPDEAGRQRISDLIEGELQDAIAAGRVGKIIARRQVRPMVGQP